MQHPDEGTLHAWLDGELEARHAADIEAHVAQCAVCSAAVAEARGFRSTSDRLIEVLQPEPARAPMRTPAARTDVARRGPRWKLWIAPLAAAAVLVLVVQLNRDGIPSLSDAATPAPAPLAGAAASPDSQGNRQGYAQPTPEEERALMAEKKSNSAADAVKQKDEAPQAANEGALARRDADQAAGLRAPESAAQAGREPGKELGDLPNWKPQTVGESGQARGREIGDLPNWKPQVLPEGAAAPMPPGTVNAVKDALGGPMRVIEGLKPAQVQILPVTKGSATVRTTYTDGAAQLTLDQRRVTSAENDAMKRPEAPAAPPPASRNAMAAAAAVNQLTWRDGDYEFLLQGPVSSDSLKALKEKVK